jgi:hypothetical protein
MISAPIAPEPMLSPLAVDTPKMVFEAPVLDAELSRLRNAAPAIGA